MAHVYPDDADAWECMMQHDIVLLSGRYLVCVLQYIIMHGCGLV